MKCVIKQRVEGQFLQNWNSLVQNSPKAINYKTFKTEFKYEEYLNTSEIYVILLCRFRTTNNKLPIETGQWQNIPRENRKCKLCNRSQIGDEYHYIYECNYFNQKRKQSLSKYFIYRHNVIKVSEKFLNLCQVKKNNIEETLSFHKCYLYRCLSSKHLVLCKLSPNLCIYCK